MPVSHDIECPIESTLHHIRDVPLCDDCGEPDRLGEIAVAEGVEGSATLMRCGVRERRPGMNRWSPVDVWLPAGERLPILRRFRLVALAWSLARLAGKYPNPRTCLLALLFGKTGDLV